jgi:hypothetical protein
MNKKKDDQVHFRCSSDEKEKGRILLKEINKSWDFLLTFFIKEFNTTSSRLQAEIEYIDKKREAIDKEMAELQERKDKLDERRHEAVEELSNTSLYDLNNYKNNEAVMGAIGSIRDYVMQRKITIFNDIPNDVFYNINKNFKVDDMELLKEISANEFERWQRELKAAEDDISDNAKMTKIYDDLLPNFRNQRYTKDWKEFIKTKDDLIKRKATSNGWTHEELLTFLNNKKPEYDKDRRR